MRKHIPAVRIFGVPFSKLGMEETVRYLVEAVDNQDPHQVITANPIMIMAALDIPGNMQMMKEADLIVPDGAGAVWAAGYIGHPVKERVPGIELMHHLLEHGSTKGWKVYLCGAAPDVVTVTAERMKQLYPGIQMVGVRDGFFTAEQDEEVIASITEAKPDLLFVARSGATQDPWIYKYKSRLQVPVMMGVGGSFDVVAGKTKRAPKLFRKLGLEWLHRLLMEPSRFGRMLVLPKFAWKVIREKKTLMEQAVDEPVQQKG
ncbi:WecB/TagA/CpsF family glycosyltransferase [Marinicrinis lubricantis]|uniref:N-acetylglucosaminyldiphosphoundecaprenol N-acetyl-beta-D-mannosaminyltransferase n=1 Tax=Marinicrinis lubricantis TaxID=2086470 RepID=A0ABW1IKH9_9BACL